MCERQRERKCDEAAARAVIIKINKWKKFVEWQEVGKIYSKWKQKMCVMSERETTVSSVRQKRLWSIVCVPPLARMIHVEDAQHSIWRRSFCCFSLREDRKQRFQSNVHHNSLFNELSGRGACEDYLLTATCCCAIFVLASDNSKQQIRRLLQFFAHVKCFQRLS